MEVFVLNIIVSVLCIVLAVCGLLRYMKNKPPTVQNHDFFNSVYYYYVPHSRKEILQLLSVSSDADPMDYRLVHRLEPELWVLERLWVNGACAQEFAVIFEEIPDGCMLSLQHLATHFQISNSGYDPYYDAMNALMTQKIHAEPIPIPR